MPLARLELWRRRRQLYARLAPDGDVVTVAEFEVQRLTELLKAVVESGRLRRPPEDKAQPLRLWRTRKLRLKA